MKFVCSVCGYVYDETVGDPDNGIAPGTKFEDLPEDFVCPLCKHAGLSRVCFFTDADAVDPFGKPG